MVLGRLVHYTVDAVLLSTVLAGVKRSSGFTPETSKIGDPTIRSIVDRFLGVGDSIFDTMQATAISSGYFKRNVREGR
ncbi:DUF1748-domain-containing protein [Rickenella mellea]|uniref:DUF1748-domain-containing protein n=1 Tax=Rickenella mellea TaxID=50990 RepID=A0A4Y7QEF2_9AGAM|nr:DUF1748-domain-containing protein [Rickenella mellea]